MMEVIPESDTKVLPGSYHPSHTGKFLKGEIFRNINPYSIVTIKQLISKLFKINPKVIALNSILLKFPLHSSL